MPDVLELNEMQPKHLLGIQGKERFRLLWEPQISHFIVERLFSCTPQNEKMNYGSEFSFLEYKTIMKLKYKPWWNTDMPCMLEG